jgi:hypothetical protein
MGYALKVSSLLGIIRVEDQMRPGANPGANPTIVSYNANAVKIYLNASLLNWCIFVIINYYIFTDLKRTIGKVESRTHRFKTCLFGVLRTGKTRRHKNWFLGFLVKMWQPNWYFWLFKKTIEMSKRRSGTFWQMPKLPISVSDIFFQTNLQTFHDSGLPDFLNTKYQNGDNITNAHKIYRIAIK